MTFEIREISGALGRPSPRISEAGPISLEDGSYYAVEVDCPWEFQLDDTPHYFTVKNGGTTTLTITNKAFSGVPLIHKNGQCDW